MKRRLFNIAAAVSLVLALLIGGLTIHSLWARDAFCWVSRQWTTATGRGGSGAYVIFNRGALLVGFESGSWTGPATSVGFGHTYGASPGPSFNSAPHPWDFELVGFWGDNYVDAQPSYTNHGRFVRMPAWLMAIALLPLPLIWVRAWYRRRHVVNHGLCPICGYDLRATPERCPECGTVPQEIKPRMGHG